MRAYITAVIFIGTLHCYFSIVNGESPLTWHFLLLVISPFIVFIWRDISNLKFGMDGIEVAKIKKDVDKTIKQAAHGEIIDQQALDTLFKSVELNDWSTLVLARMLMRKGLVMLVPNHDFGPTPSLFKLIDLCKEQDKISIEEKIELDKLRDITFYAEWWAGDIPTQGDWNWALENCRNIIGKLFDKQPIHNRKQ